MLRNMLCRNLFSSFTKYTHSQNTKLQFTVKMLLTWLLLQLHEKKKQTPNMEIERYLPEFKDKPMLLLGTLHNPTKPFEHLYLVLYFIYLYVNDRNFVLNLPERDPSCWKHTKQEIPHCIFQKGAGNNKIKARRQVRAHMHLPVIGMADGTYNRRSREGLGKVKSFLLHLE